MRGPRQSTACKRSFGQVRSLLWLAALMVALGTSEAARLGDSDELLGAGQISVTPRISLVTLPVESNALLKCLISTQNKLDKLARVHWSRLMYDENVYEQLESSSSLDFESGQPVPLVARSGSTESSASADQLAPPGSSLNRQQQLRDFLARSRQETNQISDLLIEASLSISPVKASDNASYFCAFGSQEARIDLVALSRPVVRLERVQPSRDSRSALIYWQIASDGNTPIKRTLLMLRNDTWPTRSRSMLNNGTSTGQLVTDSDRNQWQRIDIEADGSSQPEALDGPVGDVDVTAAAWPTSSPAKARLPRNKRVLKVNNLLPGVTYSFRLAAINDMGQSEWSYLSATMPNEIPAQISEIILLTRSNDSLAIGWRRPSFDTAKTIRYEMQLFDLNRTLTIDANTNSSTSGGRTNFMYIFVKLNPGTDYHFHVRACSKAGCSAFSSPKVLASTLDGEPDEPLDVELTCGSETLPNQAQVSWMPPGNPRGLLLSYTLEIEGRARYLNGKGRWQEEAWSIQLQTTDNHTLSLETGSDWLRPNSNYSARVCANNRSERCGRLSQISQRSQCSTAPDLPDVEELAASTNFHLARQKPNEEHELLSVELPVMSMRNGTIDCLQVVLIRLPKSFSSTNPGELGSTKQLSALSDYLPSNPSEIKLSQTREIVPSDLQTTGSSEYKTRARQTKRPLDEERALVYLADEFDLHKWAMAQPDDSASNRNSVELFDLNLGDGQLKLACQSLPSFRTRPLDMALQAQTFYTGFVRLILATPSNKSRLLTKYSSYFSPVKTSSSVLEFELLEDNEISGVRQSLQDSLKQIWSGQMGFDELSRRLRSSISPELEKLYNSSTSYVYKMMRFEDVGAFIQNSSPLMQLLEVATMVLVLSLLILFIVYVLTLPRAVKRKRKSRYKRNQRLEELSKSDRAAQVELQQQQLEHHQQCQLALQGQIDMQQHQKINGHLSCPSYPPNHAQQVGFEDSTGDPTGKASLMMDRLAPASYLDRSENSDQTSAAHHCNTLGRGLREHHLMEPAQQDEQLSYGTLRMRYSDVIMYHAERYREPIPLNHFRRVFECRVRNKLLREEYEKLPLPRFKASAGENLSDTGFLPMPLNPQLVVARAEGNVSALISGNESINANMIKLPLVVSPAESSNRNQLDRRYICAKSPLDADSVWDFWRLVYEQEVSTIVMLSQVEDPSSHETKCAQYWPTCDNEETTILSPCNEFVQQSDIPAAKFKIRQETLSVTGYDEEFKVRSLTLLVMASRADENDLLAGEQQQSQETSLEQESEDDYIIAERTILHLQYLCWNTGNFRNQTRLMRFIDFANKRHRANLWDTPMLVHCFSGLGRSGVFIAMSQVVDELRASLDVILQCRRNPVDQRIPEICLFQLVALIRKQRDMLISPFRFYELLYQLTANCIPSFSKDKEFAYIRLDN